MSIIRRPAPRDLPCPHCGAEPEDRCTGPTGRFLQHVHPARADAARDAGGQER